MLYVAYLRHLDIEAIQNAHRVTVRYDYVGAELRLDGRSFGRHTIPATVAGALARPDGELVLKRFSPSWRNWRRVTRNLKVGDHLVIYLKVTTDVEFRTVPRARPPRGSDHAWSEARWRRMTADSLRHKTRSRKGRRLAV